MGHASPPMSDWYGAHIDSADRVRYGLAPFRWFHAPSFLFDDSDGESDASKADVGPGK